MSLGVLYRHSIEDAFEAQEKKTILIDFLPACLTGDIIGDYSFENQLR